MNWRLTDGPVAGMPSVTTDPSVSQKFITKAGAKSVFPRIGVGLGIALLLFALPAWATNHKVHIDAIMAGLNGDTRIQFIQMSVEAEDQKAWGPQPGEQQSRALLVFFNATGVQTHAFFFTNDPPPGARTVLIATPAFAALPGAPRPDILIPPGFISALEGKVCFRHNPNNRVFEINLCLSYGDFSGDTEGGGPPSAALPITGEPTALIRAEAHLDFESGINHNDDFQLGIPCVTNTSGQGFCFTVRGPEIEVAPSHLDFGEIGANASSFAHSLVIGNAGSANPLAIHSVTLVGSDATEFRISSDSGPPTLPAFGERTVDLMFAPRTAGPKTATLRISSNDPDESIIEVELEGTGLPPGGPEIEIEPLVVDFGVQDISGNSNSRRLISIRNEGPLNALTIQGFEIAGVDADQFTLRSAVPANPLAVDAVFFLEVVFDPSTPGAKEAVARVQSNDPDEGLVEVRLRGRGRPADNCTFQNPTNAVAMDNCEEAQFISPGVFYSGNTFSATLDGSASCGLSSSTPDMWFQYLPALDGAAILSTDGSSLDTVLSAHLACPGTTANEIICNDDSIGSASQLEFAVVAGKEVWIRVSGFNGRTGAFQLFLQGPECVNLDQNGNGRLDACDCAVPDPVLARAADSCVNAEVVCPGIPYVGTTIDASNDGAALCSSSVASPDVWYRYVPETSGALVVDLAGSGFDTVLSAHSGCPGTLDNELACNDDVPGSLQSRLQLEVSAGTPIFLRLAGFRGATGELRMTLEGPACFDFDRNDNGVIDTCEFDFGDAPSPYPTRLAHNGARHRLSNLFLGGRIDAQNDGAPDAQASGDNVDGPPNDEDGVTLIGSLTPNELAQLEVVAPGGGFFNAWIDFDSDGDWSDASGEHIFSDFSLSPGVTTLLFVVPSGAVPSPRTFARYRLSSTRGLTVVGQADDGEVEDYVVEVLPVVPAPGDLKVRINEVMAGLNGDSSVQFIELEAENAAAKGWGPQPGELAGRAVLLFFDPTGRQTGRFVFPSNAPSGGNTILVATPRFAQVTGVTPDFVMPPELIPTAGKVMFRDNPDNSHFQVRVVLAYGGNGYFGMTDGAGAANRNRLPILGARSLQRTADIVFGGNLNHFFDLGPPSPLNSRSETASLTTDSLVAQGENIFLKETFNGNGRTCASCHLPGADQFGLTPGTVANLPSDDLLFLNELNVNTLVLSSPSQPSDLRGQIFGATGSARVVAGSGNSYLVHGGTGLSGIVTDSDGNSSSVLSFTGGNLAGPDPRNGTPRGIEDSSFLRNGRALILENIDGFHRGEVFRASPHLLNLALTAPFGLSGEFSNLEDFCNGAVAQHFPRSLARISGIDFRDPTFEELQAMTAFMNSISHPRDADFSLERFITTTAQKRGRDLFFGEQGKCSKCHSGPVLATSDGTLPGSLMGANENFNTGVANLLLNLSLPTEPAGLPIGQSTRKFNTPPLFGVKKTAPFFHDGAAGTLTEAVEFYDELAFSQSPAGQLVGAIPAAANPGDVADLVAFLEALVEIPVELPPPVDFGSGCPGEPSTPRILSFRNVGAVDLLVAAVNVTGLSAGDFQIVSSPLNTSVGPNQSGTLEIRFVPASGGIKQATLEITCVGAGTLGRFSFGIPLSGILKDARPQIQPGALNFGTIPVDGQSSSARLGTVTNMGNTELEFSGVSFLGAHPADFNLDGGADLAPLGPGQARPFSVQFTPQGLGTRSGLLRISTRACENPVLEVPLHGDGLSALHHFEWDPIASAQQANVPFPVRISARDAAGNLMMGFSGTVNLGVREIFRATFEPGLDGFTFNNFNGGLWHRSTGRANHGGHSPAHSIYYGIGEGIDGGGSYDRGNTGGEALSPLIDLRNVPAPITLSFNYLLESEPHLNFDFATVDVSTDNGTNFIQLVTSKAGPLVLRHDTEGLWVPFTLDLSSFRGAQIRLRFRFETLDAGVNAFEGWYIDDIVVRASTPPALNPSVSGNFTAGTWEGVATVEQPGAGLRLFADDRNGHVGEGNLFETLPMPMTNYFSSQTLGRLRNDFSGWVGMKLTVGAVPIHVSHLGRFVVAGNFRSHSIKLVDASTGLDLPGGTNTINLSGAASGQFAYASLLAPVTLAANTMYYLVSLEAAGQDQWHDLDSGITPTSAAVCNGPVWRGTGGYNLIPGLPDRTYGPLDFKYAPPQPPPVVGISNPPPDLLICSPAAISITATAAVSGAAIAKVEFFANNTKIGEDSVGPYTFEWNNGIAGVFALTARALASNGQTATSPPVPIRFSPSGPPMVGITTPVDGAMFDAPASLQMDVSAGSSCSTISRVEFFEGTTKVGEDTSAPYSFTSNGIPAGNYQFTAKAVDANGLMSTSAPVNVIVRVIVIETTFTFITNKTLGTLRNDFGGWVGMKFTVGAQPLAVTALGRICAPNNNQVHRLKLVHATTGQDVPGGVTNIAMAGGVAGQFKYQTLANPVLLAANTMYYVVSEERIGGDLWHDLSGMELGMRAQAVCNSGVYSLNSVNWFLVGGINSSYVPVDFKYSTAPPPPPPPQVTITNPVSGRAYCAPANVLLEANALVGQGSKVEFFADNSKVGEDVSAPYALVWSNVVAGAYSLTARVMDSGASATSSPVAIIVGASGPPMVGITTPVDGAMFDAPASLQMDVSAGSSCSTISRVEFFEGSTKVGEDTSAPYSFTSNGIPAGNYQFTAKAIDANGLMSTSAPVNVIVRVPPIDTAFITNKTLGTLRNDFGGWVGMKFTVGAQPLTVTALGRICAPNNNQVHRLKLVHATTGQDVPGGVTNIAMAGGVVGQFKYQTLVNPVLLAANTMYYVVSEESIGGDLWHDLSGMELGTRAQAVCNSGVYSLNSVNWFLVGGINSSYVPVDFKYSTGPPPPPPPQVTITNPVSGRAYCAPANVLLEANALAGQGSKVELFANNSKVGEDVSAPYAVVWSNVVAGAYSLTARVMDSGASATSSPVAIIVGASGPPMVAITIPVDGAMFDAPASLQMDVSAGSSCSTISRVEFFEGTTKVGEDTSAPYSFTSNGIPAGNYQFTAKAIDANGLMSTSAPVNVIVRVPPIDTTFITNKTLGTLRNDFGGWVGMKFAVGAQPLTVTALGRICAPNNNQVHRLKLVHAVTGQDVPGGVTNIAMAGGVVGQFKYQTLVNPVLLAANTMYYVVSEERIGGDLWHDINGMMLGTRAQAVCNSGVYSLNSFNWFLVGGINSSYVPVDFKYSPGSQAIELAQSTSGVVEADPVATPASLALARNRGRLELTITGPSGANCQIDSSDDMIHWTPLTSITIEGGRVVVEVPNQSEGRGRFYRIRSHR